MNPLGIHALVWVGGWSVEEAELAISSTAAAGYDVIEIPALDPSRIDIASTRELLERYGLRPTISLGLSFDADINSQDVACVARGRDTLMSALEVSRGIGSTYLGGVIFGAMAKYSGPTTAGARANSVAVIKELAQEARASDTIIGLEFVNRYESNLLNTAQQTLDYLDLVGEDNVVVHADVYHMNIEESDFRTPILACGERLGYVHVGESHRGYLGTGTIDFPEFFSALNEIDYAGPITFESFSSAVVDPLLSNTLAVWRNLWSDSMDLATQAHAFIRAGMAGG
ncbi:MAG: TIM barrel protein [Actinobacteria bacterium]|nr:TIM barrel protein [Actinomycetota bacterium]